MPSPASHQPASPPAGSHRPTSHLIQLLDAAVGHGPERVALIDPSGLTTTYGELAGRSAEAARALEVVGARPGEVVATLLPGDSSSVVALVACARIGAICAPINGRLWARERQACLALCQPSVVVTHPEFRPDVADNLTGVNGRNGLYGRTMVIEPGTGAQPWADGALPSPSGAIVRPGPGSLWFTSATTGEPRAVLVDEAMSRAATAGARHRPRPAPSSPNRRHLCAIDLSHFGGRLALLHALEDQVPLELMATWSRRELERVLDRPGPTVGTLSATGPQLNPLVRSGPVPWLDGLERLELTAGFASHALLRSLSESSCEVVLRYGAAETAGLGATLSWTGPAEDRLAVGVPSDGMAIVVRNTAGAIAEPGQVGEIELGGPTVAGHYWSDPGASRRAFPQPGVFRSGDLGVAHEDGSFSLYGRLGDRFVQDGETVDPAAVETVLGADPSVSELVIVPRPDPIVGAIGVAVTVPSCPDHPPFLHELVSGSDLAPKVRPRAQWVVDGLPLSGSGTVQRRRLVYEESTR